jgi:uncharacterized membrane protein
VRIRTQHHPNERLLVLAALVAASALCVALELFREIYYGTYGFHFLLWNLFLAWVPLVFALVAYDRYRRGVPLLRLAPALALWLVFLPNAPYIVTDFIHLTADPEAPLWFDGVVLSAFAWTGALVGFVSLYLVHAVVRHRFGLRAGWAGAFGALALTSAGVYLGRFLRWNSWDVVIRPGRRLAEVAPHLTDPAALTRAGATTLLLTLLLVATYGLFYALIGLRLEPELNRRGRVSRGS